MWSARACSVPNHRNRSTPTSRACRCVHLLLSVKPGAAMATSLETKSANVQREIDDVEANLKEADDTLTRSDLSHESKNYWCEKRRQLREEELVLLKKRRQLRELELRQGGAAGLSASCAAAPLQDIAAALLKLPLPSELQPGDITPCNGRPLLLNGRLGNAAHGLPPALQHPAFGAFLDWVQGRRRPRAHAVEAGPLPASIPSPEGQQPGPGTQLQLDHEDMEAAAALCSITAKYYEDKGELLEHLVPRLRTYLDAEDLDQPFGPFSVRDGPELSPDWCLATTDEACAALLLVLEAGNGLEDDDPSLKGFGYYSRFWASRLEDPRTPEALRDVLLRTCCPGLLIEVLGPHLRVSSLAWLDSVVLCPMTPLLNVLWMGSTDPQMVQLARALRGAKETLKELRRFCSGSMRSFAASTPLTVRTPGLDEAWPYPLREEYDNVERMAGGQHLYTATPLGGDVRTRVVVKFARHYGIEAHQEWARLNLAPALHRFKYLPGGFVMVEMELLDPASWMTLYQLSRQDPTRAESATAAALAELERAYHEGAKRFVHGDARPANCMVRRSSAGSGSGSGGWEVRFVDFEFAGEEGKDRYPVPLNPGLPWAQGAGFGQLLHHSHDTHLLALREGAGPAFDGVL